MYLSGINRTRVLVNFILAWILHKSLMDKCKDSKLQISALVFYSNCISNNDMYIFFPLKQNGYKLGCKR